MRSLYEAFACFAATLSVCAPAVAESVVAQASASERSKLASEMQSIAYEFAANPEDYSLISKVEELSWKVILKSEAQASCALPAYNLPQSMKNLNNQYVTVMNSLNAMGNVPAAVKQQSMKMMEGPINAQKKNVGMVLEDVMKYCK